jgi:orotate phosphoribosyltransferase
VEHHSAGAGQNGVVTLAARVFAASHLTGTFVLRSGRTADHYFDKYRFESDPALLAEIVSALEPLVPAGTEGLAGLELGGVPLATMLSAATGLPAYFVRKEPKKYGTEQVCEGGDVAGRRLLIVEDVVTTGGQIVLSAQDLRAEGALVDSALCVIDREGGGGDVVAAEGITLHALFTMRDLEASGPESTTRAT